MVSDNGVGRVPGHASQAPVGLGTTIVNALAKQLDAQVDLDGGDGGLKVSITRATFASHMPEVA